MGQGWWGDREFSGLAGRCDGGRESGPWRLLNRPKPGIPCHRGPSIHSKNAFATARSFDKPNVSVRPGRRSLSTRNIAMSQHSSLRAADTTSAKRNVLKRFERVALLKSRSQWKEGDRVTGLRKTRPAE